MADLRDDSHRSGIPPSTARPADHPATPTSRRSSPAPTATSDSLTEQEFENLCGLHAASTFPVDHVVDVANLDPDGRTESVRMLWSKPSPSVP